MDMFGLSSAQLESSGARWTAREILQQPQIWSDIARLVAGEAAGLSVFLKPLLAKPDLRIVLTGAGTSAHIGECLAPALSRMSGRRVEAISTTDLVASPSSYLTSSVPTLLVSFGRSGGSPESVGAVTIADIELDHCSHLIFTCDADGALYKRAQTAPRSHALLLPEKSNDRSFAMTSSFTGMLLAAALALGAVPTDGKSFVEGLAPMAKRVLPDCLSVLQRLVASQFQRVVYLGSKEFKGLARESALKMLELTDGQVVAISESSLGFRHGPKTILNSKTLVVVYVSNDDYTRQYDLDLISELRGDGVAGRVVALTGRVGTPAHPDNIVLGASGDSLAEGSDLGLCFPYVMFAQSLALLRSLSLGVRPDSPNAAGTVSRVVKGVTIHPWRGKV
jgi:tagatose-6-phosphate ketose/aldose isomerase